MDAMEVLLNLIIYGFELFGLTLLVIGLFGFIFGKSENETINRIWNFFFAIEDDEDYYI